MPSDDYPEMRDDVALVLDAFVHHADSWSRGAWPQEKVMQVPEALRRLEAWLEKADAK